MYRWCKRSSSPLSSHQIKYTSVERTTSFLIKIPPQPHRASSSSSSSSSLVSDFPGALLDELFPEMIIILPSQGFMSIERESLSNRLSMFSIWRPCSASNRVQCNAPPPPGRKRRRRRRRRRHFPIFLPLSHGCEINLTFSPHSKRAPLFRLAVLPRNQVSSSIFSLNRQTCLLPIRALKLRCSWLEIANTPADLTYVR
jgi:hypothetical protein